MKILLPLSHTLHHRNMIESGVVTMLRKRGHTVELVTDLRPRWARLRRSLRLMTLVQGELRSRTYRHKATLRRGGQKLEAAIWRKLRNRGVDLERVAIQTEARIPLPEDFVHRMFDAARVVWPTLIHMDAQENDFIKAAKLCRVPVYAVPASWDNLTTKGPFLVRPDKVLTWGEASRQHAISIHGFTPEQVSAPGPPHFHPYESVDLNSANVGRFALVAGTTLHFWSQEEATLGALLKAFGPERIHYRPHPRSGAGWNRGIDSVKQDLTGAKVVIAAFSTIVIEAALMGIPAILVAFGNGEQGKAIDHLAYDHMRDIVKWYGVHVARSLDELILSVGLAIQSDAADAVPQLRRRQALPVANCEPGIRERFCDAVERL